jgi:hypothetical protein
MEKRSAIVLKHKHTGLYYDKMAEHSKNLWTAWRFPDYDYLEIWLETHSYAPEHPGEYEPVEIELTIAIKEA